MPSLSSNALRDVAVASVLSSIRTDGAARAQPVGLDKGADRAAILVGGEPGYRRTPPRSSVARLRPLRMRVSCNMASLAR